MPRLSAEQRAHLCQFTYSDGRRCRQPRTSTGNGFCYNHSRKDRERQLLQALLDSLMESLIHHTVSNTTITFLLVRLYTAVAYGTIPPKLSNSLIRIIESLRRSLPDTQREFRNNFDPASLRNAIWKLYDEHADFIADHTSEESQDDSESPAPDAPDSSTSPADSPSQNPPSVPHAPVPLSPAEANAADFASSLSLKDIDTSSKSSKAKLIDVRRDVLLSQKWLPKITSLFASLPNYKSFNPFPFTHITEFAFFNPVAILPISVDYSSTFMPPSPSTKSQPIPARLLIVVVLLAISVFINYIDRGNLSIAAPMLEDELNISTSQLGLLLSAFWWTYACLNLLYGWLVDRVNVNWLFAGAFFLWSAATAATGLVHTFAVLFSFRLLLGVGEAVAFPAYSKILALNFSEEHRGRANSIVSSGLLLGPGFGLLTGGFLMGRYGWRPFFIVLGLASMLWLIPWVKWMPEKHQAAPTESTGAPNLWEFFQMRSAWGTCLGLFFSNYANYFLITWLPYFLVRERHFSMNSMAKIGGTAYLLGGAVSPICGWLADRWLARGASPTLARKSFVAGGIACCGIFLGLAGALDSRFTPALIALGVVSYSVMSSNLWAISQALAGPTAAGRWVGFQNFFGNLSGMLAPALTGIVVDRTGRFFWAFVIVAMVCLGSSASWIFLVGRIEPVVWGSKAARQRGSEL